VDRFKGFGGIKGVARTVGEIEKTGWVEIKIGGTCLLFLHTDFFERFLVTVYFGFLDF